MRDEISLTDAEIEERFDAIGCCCAVEDVTFTRDTLADFRVARLGYAKPGTLLRDADGEMVIDGAQVARGTPRQDLYIIDFGAARGVAR